MQAAGWKKKKMVVFFSDKIDDLRYMFNHHPEMHMWHFVQYDAQSQPDCTTCFQSSLQIQYGHEKQVKTDFQTSV